MSEVDERDKYRYTVSDQQVSRVLPISLITELRAVRVLELAIREEVLDALPQASDRWEVEEYVKLLEEADKRVQAANALLGERVSDPSNIAEATMWLLADGGTLSTAMIVQTIEEEHPDLAAGSRDIAKAVNGALKYGVQTGRITRVRRGQYRIAA